MNDVVKKIIGNIKSLGKMWGMTDTWCERPVKYILKALPPVTKFRKNKMKDSAAVRKLYPLLTVARKGARTVGLFKLPCQ